ncbi:hypothetical protein RGQ15_10175 [Paracoccus sp. MBLB3053]|uniref:Uncharacterized protein n=1 Tax=Paracoccus aurantius TaxID=3073814 RepID=A0ABU2HSC0_9RHOB|nr:hypothetical protein [Paracoccus sp. MBLB3053]MDS9467931.1 hypothetical protein [Paracoccus sp. MBLB3053]
MNRIKALPVGQDSAPLLVGWDSKTSRDPDQIAQKKAQVALAGATEVEIESFWDWAEINADRQAKASKVIESVMDCEPEDRVLFLETILDQIRPGWPKSFNIDVMEEAGWWADTATTPERKAYMLACYRRLSRADRAAFLTYITGGDAA